MSGRSFVVKSFLSDTDGNPITEGLPYKDELTVASDKFSSIVESVFSAKYGMVVAFPERTPSRGTFSSTLPL